MKIKIEPDLLDWTSGKVKGFFSKELLNLDAGNLKLIKIDPYAIYPGHIHPEKTEYAYVLEGNPEFVIDSGQYKSQPGDFFIFHQKVNHNISIPSGELCIILIGAVKNVD